RPPDVHQKSQVGVGSRTYVSKGSITTGSSAGRVRGVEHSGRGLVGSQSCKVNCVHRQGGARSRIACTSGLVDTKIGPGRLRHGCSGPADQIEVAVSGDGTASGDSAPIFNVNVGAPR